MTGWGWLVTNCSTRSFLIIKTFPSAADCCWICPGCQHLVQTIIQSPSHLMPDDFGLGHLKHILAIKSYKWQDHFWYQPNKGHRRAILGLLGTEKITVSIKNCVNKNNQTIHFSQGRNARMICISQVLKYHPGTSSQELTGQVNWSFPSRAMLTQSTNQSVSAAPQGFALDQLTFNFSDTGSSVNTPPCQR